jgi:hypothetical protein
MNLPSYSEAIKSLLDKKTHPELASLYHKGMEVQVNVGRDGGNRVEGVNSKVWTDGLTKWYAIRIPKNAASTPEDNSGLPMGFDIFAHAEGIGITGWNWELRQSERFGYDFDAIIGHSEKHKKKLSDSELDEVRKQAMSIPFVETRKSTSGSGLHLWVKLEKPVATKTHTEHAALGRSILALMSSIAGFDFTSKVDACGGNMWIWHRKMRDREGTIRGLHLVKAAERNLMESEIPPNWQSHVRVVSGNRQKVLPEFVEKEMDRQDDIDRIFEELSGQHPRVRLDDEHRAHIKWLQEHQGFGWWDPDHHMLVTHTKHLERMHQELNLKGIFKTNSPGSEVEEQNCFCFPLRNGAWSVRRYTPGVAEDKSWSQDGVGYTTCYFNREPNLGTASRSNGGVEDDKGAFRFPAADMAAEVVKNLGGNLNLPSHLGTRLAKLTQHKDGNRLVLEVEKRSDDDPKKMDDWFQEKSSWRRVISVNKVGNVGETEIGLHDEVVRHVVTESRLDAGWYVRCGQGWNYEPLAHVGRALLSLGRKKAEVDAILGAAVFKPWVLVNRPFEVEYPGDRLWNRDAVQFRYPRVDQSEIGEHPTWTKIMEHVGKGLDEAIRANGWAQANDVKTGATYVKLWLASLLQDPYRPLPYLFLYGSQNAGKSIYHEAIKLLITGGIVDAGDAIKNKGNFNGELESAILCYIEEINLRKDKEAYTKIKHWVTSPEINIHKKGLTPYMQPNTTHWIHCANDHEACPIFPGDTRITMIEVPPLSQSEMIAKEELRELLRKEAPHFLNALLSEEIPPSGDRLGLPVISTSEREALAKANQNSLETFIDEHCQQVPGAAIIYSEFWDKFYNILDPYEQTKWSKKRLTGQLPPCFPTGKFKGPNIHIGNIAWIDPNNPVKSGVKLIRRGDTLVPSDGK